MRDEREHLWVSDRRLDRLLQRYVTPVILSRSPRGGEATNARRFFAAAQNDNTQFMLPLSF